MNRSYYTTPQPSAIMRALWKACGADKNILERSTYSDHVKYACLGGIVLTTGIMASIAGGYAFYTIFEPKGEALDNLRTVSSPSLIKDKIDIATCILSCIFGLIWGAIIFNIDRFIVTSTGKGDGTEAITWEELKGAIPRILMGIIIALTISKPLEIRMFKSEIDRKLQQVQDSVELVNIKLAEHTFNKNTEVARNNLSLLENQINIYRNRWAFLDSMVTYENTHGGCHGKCEENKKEREEIIKRIDNVKKSEDYLNYKKKIEYYTAEFDTSKAKAKKDKVALDGLLLRIQLAHKVSVDKDGDFPWISFFITLLFMAIELTPIFFKLMLVKSPYDYLEQNIKELIKAEEGIEVQYDFYQGKKGIEKDLVKHHKAELLLHEKMKLIEAQKELSIVIIDKWKEKEIKNIGEDPDSYITKG